MSGEWVDLRGPVRAELRASLGREPTFDDELGWWRRHLAPRRRYTRFQADDRVSSSDGEEHGTVLEVFDTDHPDNQTGVTRYAIAWDTGEDSGYFEADSDLLTECPNCGSDAINSGVCSFCGEGGSRYPNPLMAGRKKADA